MGSGISDPGHLGSQLLASLKAEYHDNKDIKLPTLCQPGERVSDRKDQGCVLFFQGKSVSCFP